MDSRISPPKKIPKYSSKQPKFEWMDGMLPARWLACASSGSGKTVAIINLLTNHFTTKSGDSVFDRIYLFSPTAFSDDNWRPVDELVRKRSANHPHNAHAHLSRVSRHTDRSPRDHISPS